MSKPTLKELRESITQEQRKFLDETPNNPREFLYLTTFTNFKIKETWGKGKSFSSSFYACALQNLLKPLC